MPDMIHSADALTHISEIRVPDAVERMRILMRDGGDPGPGKSVYNFMNIGDLRQQNRLRIAARFGSVVAGHRLSELVTLLLMIEGFKVSCRPPARRRCRRARWAWSSWSWCAAAGRTG